MADNESENDELAEETVAEGSDPSATDALEAALAELESGIPAENGDEGEEEGEGPPPALKKRQALRAVTKTRTGPGERPEVIKQKPKSQGV